MPLSLYQNQWSKWHNSTVYRNIYQSTIVLEICEDLLFFGYSSLGNMSFTWYRVTWKNFDGTQVP